MDYGCSCREDGKTQKALADSTLQLHVQLYTVSEEN